MYVRGTAFSLRSFSILVLINTDLYLHFVVTVMHGTHAEIPKFGTLFFSFSSFVDIRVWIYVLNVIKL